MHFNRLDQVAAFLEQNAITIYQFKLYTASHYPAYQYQVDCTDHPVSFTAALPIDMDTGDHDLKQTIEHLQTELNTNRTSNNSLCTPSLLKTQISYLTNLTCQIIENVCRSIENERPSQLPFEITNTAIGRFIKIDHYHIKIQLGPTHFEHYIGFITDVTMRRSLDVMIRKQLGDVFSYALEIMIYRDSIPPSYVHGCVLGISSWLSG